MPIESQSGTVTAVAEEVDRLRRSVRELGILNDLAYTIAASNDLEFVLRTVLHRSVEAVTAHEGVITLLDPDDGSPARTLVRTVADRSVDVHHMDRHLLGWIATHKRPLRVSRDDAAKRFPAIDWDPTVVSILCAPLMTRGRLIGALAVYNRDDGSGFTRDDERLLAIVGSQSAQVLENARHLEHERQFAALKNDLEVAARIQAALLPGSTPDVPGFDLAGRSLPARTVGGDYFDFVGRPGGRFALCLADVSGKGLPASLLVANLHATIRGLLQTDLPLPECVRRTNGLMCERSRDETFVTFFAAEIDPVTARLEYCNAGHNPPRVYSRKGRRSRLEPTGMVLGVMPAAAYDSGRLDLAPGDRLVVYSDGITEAEDAAERGFGEERLDRAVEGADGRTAFETVERILDAVDTYADPDRPAADDRTVVVLARDRT